MRALARVRERTAALESAPSVERVAVAQSETAHQKGCRLGGENPFCSPELTLSLSRGRTGFSKVALPAPFDESTAAAAAAH